MSLRDIRRFLAAPELHVVDISIAALATLLRAVSIEHPALDETPDAEEALVRRRARLVLRGAHALRRALVAYADEVANLVDDLHRDDLPF